MHRTLLGGAFALCLTLGGGAHAQDAPDRARLSLAAGYKAAFLCSGLFNGGLDEATVAADDLTRIYEELREPVAELPAVIDRQARTVSVAFADDMPPRTAVWRPHLGGADD